MKINDPLIFLPDYISRMGARAFPSSVQEIRVALSLQSFHLPPILLESSEHTHKIAVLCK